MTLIFIEIIIQVSFNINENIKKNPMKENKINSKTNDSLNIIIIMGLILIIGMTAPTLAVIKKIIILLISIRLVLKILNLAPPDLTRIMPILIVVLILIPRIRRRMITIKTRHNFSCTVLNWAAFNFNN